MTDSGPTTIDSRPEDADPVVTRICIVGHVCIDDNWSADGTGTRLPGSPAVYMLGQFARFENIETSIIAAHGTDFDDLLPDAPLVNPAGHRRTLLYRNFFEHGRRHQECRNTDDAAPPSLGQAERRALRAADIVIVAPLIDDINAPYLDEVFEAVTPDALTILLPQGYLRRVGRDHRVRAGAFADHARILPHFDVVVFSDEDCDDALDTARAWSSEIPRARIVVTQNSAGATLFDQGVATHVDAAPISSVDAVATIGAGDVFSAHLALAMHESPDLPAAVGAANIAAGRFLDRSAQDGRTGIRSLQA